MDKQQRVLFTQLPALVDDLLTPTLHLGIVTLDRSKIQILLPFTGVHRRGRTATKTNLHRGSAKDNQLAASRIFTFVDMLGTDITHTTSEHDRLVIATHFNTSGTIHRFFIGTEVTTQSWPTKLIVKCGTTQWAFNHNIERRDDTVWLAVSLAFAIGLPRLDKIGNIQVRDRKSGKACFGLAASPRSTFVTDLPARTGRSTWPWCYCRWMVVSLDLHQDMNILFGVTVGFALRVGEEATTLPTSDNSSVVFVGREHTFGIHLIGVTDHGEQGFLLCFTIDIP